MIKAITDDKVRREEFIASQNPIEFTNVFNELNGEYPKPTVVGKEGTLYSLYYDKKPSMFTEDAELYALKVDTSTGTESKKAYYRGNISGLTVDYEVIATGTFLDEPEAYTLYHGEGVSFEEAITMTKPYTGTTYKNGEVTRITNYNKG